MIKFIVGESGFMFGLFFWEIRLFLFFFGGLGGFGGFGGFGVLLFWLGDFISFGCFGVLDGF